MLLRELGLGRSAIAEGLDGQRDQVAALQWLHAERERLGQLTDIVSRTIHQLQGGEQMTAPKLFEGFEVGPDLAAGGRVVEQRLQRRPEPPGEVAR